MSNLASQNSKNMLGQGALGDVVNTFGTNMSKSANTMFNGATKSANTMFNGATNALNGLATNATKSANSVLNGATNALNGLTTNATKSTNSMLNTNLTNVFKSANNSAFVPLTNNSQSTSYMPSSDWLWPLGIFTGLVIIFIILITYFINEIRVGYTNLSNSIRSLLNMDASPPVPLTVTAPPATTNTPPTLKPTYSQLQSQSILESVLPLKGPPEVFNVSKNEFSYYDAEPLCKALGAELATYEQVKDAYGSGADWCNYGWTKGQVAIYPTQKATWDELQSGSDDERNACGKPGVNGGYFDNPEMKFGVNCYGPKPGQSGHDEAALMKQGRIPSTVASLKTEQKVKEFEAQAESLGVMPFNKNKWQSA